MATRRKTTRSAPRKKEEAKMPRGAKAEWGMGLPTYTAQEFMKIPSEAVRQATKKMRPYVHEITAKSFVILAFPPKGQRAGGWAVRGSASELAPLKYWFDTCLMTVSLTNPPDSSGDGNQKVDPPPSDPSNPTG